MPNIHPTAIVDPGARVGSEAVIGPFCVIGPQVEIGDGCRLHSHVVIDGHTRLGHGNEIFPFASLGLKTQDLKWKGGVTRTEIGDENTFREYVTVNSATSDGEVTVVGSRNHILAYCHVAHNVVLGNNVIMSNVATLAGHIVVEDHAVVGGLAAVHQFCRIGRMSIIGGCSKVVQDVPPFMLVDGNPAETRTINLPKLRPSNSPISADGADSRPSTMSSRYFSFPDATSGAHSWMNAGNRSLWSETMKPLIIARWTSSGRRFGPLGCDVALYSEINPHNGMRAPRAILVAKARHVVAELAQRGGGGAARQAAADHDHVVLAAVGRVHELELEAPARPPALDGAGRRLRVEPRGWGGRALTVCHESRPQIVVFSRSSQRARSAA